MAKFGWAMLALAVIACTDANPDRVYDGGDVIVLGTGITVAPGAELTQFLGAGTAHHPNDPSTRPEMNLFHMDGPAIFKLARASCSVPL